MLNTTSTADISFMLLIFFLVVSAFDSVKGLSFALPPADKHEEREELLMQKDNVMQLQLTAGDTLMIDNKVRAMSEVQPMVVKFIERVGQKHVIVLDISPDATYNVYIELRDRLKASYREARDKIAWKRWGKNFAMLEEGQRDSIRNLCPQHVYESY